MFKLGTKVDDMLKAWTKADDAARIEGTKRLGLPDNNTAADRAKAMGFGDETYYHGSGSSFDEFDPSFTGSGGVGENFTWLTDSPKVASSYAEHAPIMNAKIIKDIARMKYGKGKPYTSGDKHIPTDELKELNFNIDNPSGSQVYPLKIKQGSGQSYDMDGEAYRSTTEFGTLPTPEETFIQDYMRDKLSKGAKDDYTIFNSLDDHMSDVADIKPAKHIAVNNQSIIRSPLAHFNPKMAGIGAGAIMSANLMADELDLEHKPKVSAWDSLMNTIGGVNQQQAQAYGDTGAGAFNLASDIIADPSVVAELGMKGFKGTGLGAILQSNEVQAAEKPDFFQQLQRKR